MWIVTLVGHKADPKETETFTVRGNSRRAVSENVRAKTRCFDSAVGKLDGDTLTLRPSKTGRFGSSAWVAHCRRVADTGNVDLPTPPMYDFTTSDLVCELVERLRHSNGWDFVPGDKRAELLDLLTDVGVA